jgi:hypothetical protein
MASAMMSSTRRPVGPNRFLKLSMPRCSRRLAARTEPRKTSQTKMKRDSSSETAIPELKP